VLHHLFFGVALCGMALLVPVKKVLGLLPLLASKQVLKKVHVASLRCRLLTLKSRDHLDYHRIGSAMGLSSPSGVPVAPHTVADLHSIFISLTLDPLPGLFAWLGSQ
jgi:hypothetical protein